MNALIVKWPVVGLLAAGMLAFGAVFLASPAKSPTRTTTPISTPGLSAFASDDALRAFLRRVRREGERRAANAPPAPMMMMSVPAPAADSAEPVAAAQSGITNNQVIGVDEGDIVKVRGDVLIILRRGRLFTTSLAGGTMLPISMINAFPPGIDASGDWYDEMLLAGDHIVVIGFSYRREGAQVNRFRIDDAGRLAFEDSYQLRSNDYYSSRNYASRLIGNRLVFYTPLYLYGGDDPLDALPALRRWQRGAKGSPWKRIASGRHIYIPPVLRDPHTANITTLHSVTSCDLTAPVLDCSASGVLGADSRTFFVSEDAVYLWISDAWRGLRRGRRADGFIYRLPLDQGRPSAVAARGAPVDQFSFLADTKRGELHVVVRAEGGGDAMWRPEVSEGAVALLDVPLAAFGDGSREVPRSAYRSLPTPKGDSWSFHNRFVGDYLLYGAGAFGDTGNGILVAAPLGGGGVVQLPLMHAVDRIEAIGRDAMIVGGGKGGLGFTSIVLPGTGPARLGSPYMLADAAEGETRSHAFFFRADPRSPDGATGLMALPVARSLKSPTQRFLGASAAMLFLRREEGRLAGVGELVARSVAGEDSDDGCQASCVDWYGNARPIFIGDRVFALLGYELVEGLVDGGRIREIGRVSFAPAKERLIRG